MSDKETIKEETKKEESSPVAEKSAKETFPLKVILGEKVGITQIYSESGEQIPVSVIYTATCTTTEVRNMKRDGYQAVQLGVGEVREKSVNQPYGNQFKKKNIAPARWLKEFRVTDSTKFQVGQKVPLDVFEVGDYVDVSGITKGKGFAGAMKRHGFHGLPHSHGASNKERSRGSSGGGSGEPQRVLKGTRMAGRMGGEWVTTHGLEVIKIDKDNGVILIKGSVPGAVKNIIIVKETVKGTKHKVAPKAAAKVAKKAAPKKAAPKKAAAKGK